MSTESNEEFHHRLMKMGYDTRKPDPFADPEPTIDQLRWQRSQGRLEAASFWVLGTIVWSLFLLFMCRRMWA